MPTRCGDTLSRWICADTAGEGGAECIGPSLAFAPLRGTKDCTQDDSFEAQAQHDDRMRSAGFKPIWLEPWPRPALHPRAAKWPDASGRAIPPTARVNAPRDFAPPVYSWRR